MDYIKELMIKAEDEANDLLLAELLMNLALEEDKEKPQSSCFKAKLGPIC